MDFLNKLFKRPKLSLIFIAVLLAVSGLLAVSYVTGIVESAQYAHIVEQQISQVIFSTRIIDALQKERAASVAFLSPNIPGDEKFLNDKYALTDKLLDELGSNPALDALRKEISSIRQNIASLPPSSGSILAVTENYSRIIEEFNNSIVSLVQKTQDNELKTKFHSLIFLTRAKELLGQARMMLLAVIDSNGFTNQTLQAFASLTSVFNYNIERFVSWSQPEIKNYFISHFNTPAVSKTRELIEKTVLSSSSGVLETHSNEWWLVSGETASILFDVESFTLKDITETLSRLRYRVYTHLLKVLFFIVFVLTMLIVSSAPRQETAPEEDARMSRIYQSPVYLLILVVVSIFGAQTISALLIRKGLLPPFSPIITAFIDSLLTMLMVIPILYLFLFCPLILHIRQRHKAQQEQKRLLKELSEQNARLEQLNRLMSEYVSDVSHEFKNPLTVIRESINITLKRDTANAIKPRDRRMLELGRNNTDRLIRLINDLLDLSKIESGRITIHHTRINASDIINDVLSMYATAIEEKKLTVSTHSEAEDPTVDADADKITQVVINLLSNAIKYTRPGDRIDITIRRTDSFMTLEFADTGPGIEPQDLPRIFDKFERITAESQEGTGLGLPIAKEIVELHGGSIQAQSTPGKGSVFTVTLPVHVSELI
ncbi:MAG: hypothetical protein C4541_13375 [Candidatus Auribacter fodinae]|jgi:signal transduction histidine kinase|uniref:histidine kinase n=1 Tax=Candidatus Auribacter fodinae TaxID=2093366 RepID=A0A3A4QPE3_9BACT|nr:MAG: hypothetical protein C4541_13375 [Candidatus Auribacter fodinae]